MTASGRPGAASAIVVGGGIAGIAAALRLAERGVAVTLLETRKKLGGRATSFQDVRTGLVIDNCQHVAMGCCTNYLDLCGRLGVSDKLRWHREIYWVEAGGRTSVMKPGVLPAPGHMALSFLGARFLTGGEKFAIARAMLAAMRVDRHAWADRTFGAWLDEQRQPRGAVEKFWAPVIVSACNLRVERVSAESALHVFQEGFLEHRDAPLMGVAAVPLVEMYDPAEGALRAAGGEIRLGASVAKVGAREVTLSSGETLRADAVVLATTPERAARLVSDEERAADARFGAMEGITHSPILGVHLVFDRPVLPYHAAVLVARPTQWLFRKDEAGTHVHAVISGADEWVALPEEEITRRVVEDVTACFPEARAAKVMSSRPVKEKLATFAPTPEVERLRPRTLGARGREGIVLAGDYVQTSWPATMEGATRSGYMAAAAVMGEDVEGAVLPGLRRGLVARVVMGRG